MYTGLLLYGVHTSSLLRLLPQALLERALLLQGGQLLRFALWMALRVVVLCEDAVSVGINDHESRYSIKRQIHGLADEERVTRSS